MRRLASVLLPLALAVPALAAPPDALRAAVERWSGMAAEERPGDETWEQIAPLARTEMERASGALGVGLPLEALRHAAFAGELLDGAAYVRGRPQPEHQEVSAFDAEWARVGRLLEESLGHDAATRTRAIGPAAQRAVAQRAFLRAWEYHRASREYARASSLDDGLFYLGGALAQRDLVDLCARIVTPPPGRPLALPRLGSRIDALEAELLGRYCPPASLERHREFILANAAIKESRELEAAGLAEGALLVYLEAVRAAAELPGPEAAPGPASEDELAALDARLREGGRDHGVGRLVLEIAMGELRLAPRGTRASAAIAGGVLPRYFEALEPEPVAVARPAPVVTVTLVRWPYT